MAQIKKLSLWKKINFLPNPKIDKWYLSVGRGMGDLISVNKMLI